MNSQATQLEPTFQSTYLHGLAQLMTRVFRGEDLTELGLGLVNQGQTGDAQALLDLSVLLQLQGQPELAMTVQQQALQLEQHYQLPPANDCKAISLLAIVAPGNLMTNTPLEFIAEGAGFNLQLLYVDQNLPLPQNIPEHDIAIVALSELDANMATLDYINSWIDLWPRPVLNAPNAISVLGRDLISQKLQHIAGLEIPLTVRVGRDKLEHMVSTKGNLAGLIDDGEEPVIIRPIDSHAGIGLEKLDEMFELQSYLTRYDEVEFFVSRYVDYRKEDGQFRKYRIAVIDGQAHLAHLAVCDQWKIYFGTAGMEASAVKRSEEASEMASFKDEFAKRHAYAISALHQAVGLDYFGIDCSETQDGKLLIFEVGASMNIHSMDSAELYPYKQPQMQSIFNHFQDMLRRKQG
ncbi:MAG: glutathione synthase/RimK-type ligase-like ATP-grasp enzyme [Oleispira sp.]|jgi:glutathione synthase/RimK-type ligase-like ATP-grasp enzyme